MKASYWEIEDRGWIVDICITEGETVCRSFIVGQLYGVRSDERKGVRQTDFF